MSEISISAVNVRVACDEPYPTLAEARGIADLIERTEQWLVEYHNPPVEIEDQPGVLAVASVSTLSRVPLGRITYLATALDLPGPSTSGRAPQR